MLWNFDRSLPTRSGSRLLGALVHGPFLRPGHARVFAPFARSAAASAPSALPRCYLGAAADRGALLDYSNDLEAWSHCGNICADMVRHAGANFGSFPVRGCRCLERQLEPGVDLHVWVPRTSSTSRHQAVFADHATDASLPSDAVL